MRRAIPAARSLGACCSVLALALALAPASLHAQAEGEGRASASDQPTTPSVTEQADEQKIQFIVTGRPPPGFEDIDTRVETMFDVIFAGTRLGSATTSLEDGVVVFRDPQAVASLFPDFVDKALLVELLSQPLDANEDQRCLPGRSTGCGVLPPGQSGVIANPENFTIEVFLANSYFDDRDPSTLFVSDPISGPSLIQTAQLSLSTGRNDLDSVRYGATFDTLASLGRTSFSARTFLRDRGANLQTASLRHLWQDRFAAGGLLQDEQSLTFRSFRVLGGEFGSFFGSRLDQAQAVSTPIEIVLPRAARVEVYRDSVLIQTFQMEAGLQTISTAGFPPGSYPIRILATDGDMIVLDETQVFTRVSDLPPEGELAFRVRGGLRVRETSFTDFRAETNELFLPEIADDPVVSAQIGKRIGAASALEAQVLAVDDTVYGELAFTTYRDDLTGFTALSAGSDGSYSALLSGNLQMTWASFSLSARHTRLGGDFVAPGAFGEEFRPYFRSEDLITASASLPLGSGVFSLTGTYSRAPEFDDRYTIGARYNMPLEIGRLGGARLSVFGFQTDRDTRAGLSISFYQRHSPRTTAYYGAGAEYRDSSNSAQSGQPDGIFPIVEGRVTRSMDWGNAEVLGSVGASTDADRHRAFGALDISSNLGLADLTVEYEDRRGQGGDGISVAGNAFSGIAIGGGKARFGMRELGGDAALLIDIDRSQIPEEYRDGFGETGQYSVYVDNREVGQFDPNSSTTILLPALREYSIQLQPENAPPYAIDLTRRTVPLWPGNVVRLNYSAQLAVTLFGRLVDPQGSPLGNSRISIGAASTLTDAQGYFLVTGTLDQELVPYDADNLPCLPQSVAELIEGQDGEEYFRIGELVCAPPGD